jgi:hypothetical protein
MRAHGLMRDAGNVQKIGQDSKEVMPMIFCAFKPAFS